MTVPIHRRLRARDLPDLTTDGGPFTEWERDLMVRATRELFRAEPDTPPEPAPSSVDLFWMVVAVAFISLVLVFGFLLGATTGQGLHY